MKLKDLLESGAVKKFNLDIIGVGCHWQTPAKNVIIYSGEVTHDYYDITKETVDEKYLNFSVVDLTGFDDGLTIAVEAADPSAVEEQTIKKLESKVQELQEICFEYSQGVYELLGEFSDESALNPFERLSLKRLKAIIDKNLANNNYKKYLEHRYIDKDLEALQKEVGRVNREVEELVEERNNTFIKNVLTDTYPEDDTDTLVIK